jgi:hypothetical protein
MFPEDMNWLELVGVVSIKVLFMNIVIHVWFNKYREILDHLSGHQLFQEELASKGF